MLALLDGCGFCPAFVRAHVSRSDRCDRCDLRDLRDLRDIDDGGGVQVVVMDVDDEGDVVEARADADRFARCARDVVLALAPLMGARRPRRLVVTYLPCDAPRMLPSHSHSHSQIGGGLDPVHVNGGVTWRARDGTTADVLVFRREDAVKVLVHELLHAHGWGESISPDTHAGAEAGRALALACGVRRGPRSQQPKRSPGSGWVIALDEACVEAAACEVAARWAGGEAAWRRARARAGTIAKAAVAHFAAARAGEWRETTHAFAYIVGRWALMSASASGSVVDPIDAPEIARTIAKGMARLREPRSEAGPRRRLTSLAMRI